MNDRARAIAVLKQARDMLADRLSERVLESRSEILEDAQGFSFLSELESIYEQFGARLVHLNQLLANLPTVDEAPPLQPGNAAAPHEAEVHLASGAGEATAEGSPAVTRAYVGIVNPALPAPPRVEPTAEPARQVTFQPFAAQIHAGEFAAAGRSLAELFGLSESRGIECARVFADHMRSEPGFLLKAVQLRSELQAGGWNAVTLLWECFGLSGFESLGVLQTLRQRLDQEPEHG